MGEPPTEKRKGNLVDRINTSSKYYVALVVATNGLESKHDIINGYNKVVGFDCQDRKETG